MFHEIGSFIFRTIRQIALFSASFQREGKTWFLWLPGLFFSRFKNLEYRKVIWLDLADDKKIKLIKAEQNSLSVGPQIESEFQVIREIKNPAIWLYRFENATVTATSSHILTNDFAFIERIPTITTDIADYRSGLIFEHSSKFSIVTGGFDHELESAIFLGGNGSWNYYHWLIEILPKLAYLLDQKLHSEKSILMVNEKISTIPSFNTIFKKAIENSDVNVFYMKDNTRYKVRELFHLTSPNNIAFNLKQKKFSPEFNFLSPESIHYIRRLVETLDHDTTLPPPQFEKLFLARKGGIRSYNQDEIYLVLEKHGFKKIFIEDYTLVEQASIFKFAKVIVGPTGAAWTNLIFCSPGTKSICWMAEGLGNFSAFSNLAHFSQVDLVYINYNSKESNLYRSHYNLDPNKILKALNLLN